MKIECDEGGAWAVILVALIAGISAAVVVGLTGNHDVKVECYKTQQVAIAASTPKVPECK